MAEITSPQASPATVPAELPTAAAKLTISLRPTQMGGTAEATVPADQAHHLITTFTLLGSTVTGIGGAVLMLYMNRNLVVPAIGALVLAFVAAVLIAISSQPLPAEMGGGKVSKSAEMNTTTAADSSA